MINNNGLLVVSQNHQGPFLSYFSHSEHNHEFSFPEISVSPERFCWNVTRNSVLILSSPLNLTMCMCVCVCARISSYSWHHGRCHGWSCLTLMGHFYRLQIPTFGMILRWQKQLGQSWESVAGLKRIPSLPHGRLPCLFFNKSVQFTIMSVVP